MDSTLETTLPSLYCYIASRDSFRTSSDPFIVLPKTFQIGKTLLILGVPPGCNEELFTIVMHACSTYFLQKAEYGNNYNDTSNCSYIKLKQYIMQIFINIEEEKIVVDK